jgi:hypothetical protein
MAYLSQNLSALSYANGFTLWHYRTSDIAANLDDAGYFNGAAKMLRAGDFILVNAGIGGTPSNGLVVVVSNTGTVVDCSNFFSLAVLNSD